MEKLPITKAGEKDLIEKLRQLKTKDRPEISQAIAEARAHGDLKENAEYHAAKEQQGFIEAKIQEIEHALGNAQVIDVKEIPETGRVVFGATIDLFDIANNKSITYKIVGNLESDPEAGLISIQTPIAQGLMGKNVGDEVADLSGWEFTNGVLYVFPDETFLSPGQFIVLVANAQFFATQYPDVHHCAVSGAPVLDLVDIDWVSNDFIPTVQQRGAAIIKARGLSSAASAANAAIEHMRDWSLGTNGGIVSMGIHSDGSYGIAEGLIYSYPVTCADGNYEIVQGLEINDFSKELMLSTEQELKDERDAIASLLP